MTTAVFSGDELKRYHFGEDHPFGPYRYEAFMQRFEALGLDKKVSLQTPALADIKDILRFHTAQYVEEVQHCHKNMSGALDGGDTPVFDAAFEATSYVVGTVLKAVQGIVEGTYQRAFVPIAGLHHARRDGAAGFCIFNDCGIAIEALRYHYGIQRLAYVDIDAHHGDGVFYAFEDDPDVGFVDLHEDGHFLYPGTGMVEETGKGVAEKTKLNIPMPPGADDDEFYQAWEKAETYLRTVKPEFIIFQCGADSLAGDPITHMKYSSAAHAYAAKRLVRLADDMAEGRLLALGGGGYNLDNLAEAWTAVVNALVECD